MFRYNLRNLSNLIRTTSNITKSYNKYMKFNYSSLYYLTKKNNYYFNKNLLNFNHQLNINNTINNNNNMLIQFRSFGDSAFLEKSEVLERVMETIGSFDKVDKSKLTEEITFKELGLDSLDAVEIVMAVEEEFAVEIPDEQADKILSVKDAVEYIAAHPMAK